MTAKESLTTHDLGTGLKAWEIMAQSGGVQGALVGLISYQPGNQPADLGNNRMVGRWAGHRILAVGDYAEDDDIPGFDGPPLSWLYNLCETRQEVEADAAEPTLESVKTANRRYTAINGHRADTPGWVRYCEEELPEQIRHWQARQERRRQYGFYDDIAIACQGMVEQGASVRFCGDGWLTQVPVRAVAVGVGGTAEYQLRLEGPADARQRVLDFYTRCRVKEADWKRAPRDLSWHGITDAEQDQGQKRLLANLDKRQFIDPVAFGEVPTTAGIMRGDWGSAAGLVMLLFHPKRRGGGDLPDGREYDGATRRYVRRGPNIRPTGAWRNCRLIATSELAGEFPTTDEVRASFKDISPDIVKAVATCKDW